MVEFLNINDVPKKKAEQEPGAILLEDCELSIVAYQSFKSLEILTLEDLSKYREEDLAQKLSKINNRTIKEARALLAEHGLEFRKD